MISNPYEVLQEYIVTGNLEEVRNLIHSRTEVELDAEGQPIKLGEEQANKRRRLNENTNAPLDPTHDNNHAVYLALEFGHYAIVDMFLDDPRVIASLNYEDFLHSAIAFHHNSVANRILDEPNLLNLDSSFVRACECNNTEVLEMIMAPGRICRVNLAHSVPVAIASIIEHDDCGEVLYFLMTCSTCKALHFNRGSILTWAMEHSHDSILALFFSDPQYIFDTSTFLDAFDLNDSICVPMMLGHENTDIGAFQDEALQLGYQVDCSWMKLFKEASKPADVIPEISYSYLPIACLQNDASKVRSVLEHVKSCIPVRLVNLLLNTCCMAGKLDALHALLQDSNIYWSAGKEVLDSVTEGLLRQGDAYGLKLVHSALQNIEQDYGIDQYILLSMKENIDHEHATDSLESLERTSKRVLAFAEEYQKNGFIWLAALIKLSVAHHNAILTIAAQPFYLPPEVTDMILMQELLNLESFY